MILMVAMRRSVTFATLLVLVPQAAFAEVIISEIMYDAPGSDSKAEWVEIQNTGSESVDLTKWKINDGSNHVLNAPPKNGSMGTLILESGAYLVLANDAGTFIDAHPNMSVSVIDTTLSLSNDGGKISLINASSTVEDKVTYSGSKAAGTGASLQKVNDKFVEGLPTPGALNAAVKIAAPTKAKALPKATPKATNTSTKKAAKTNTQSEIKSDDPTSDIVIPDAETQFAAVAAVPLNTGSSFMPWVYGTLALGVAGASAALIARQKRNGEWDIEEIA